MSGDEPSLSTLFIWFGALILASAYFSSSETGMMSLNRYRMNHLKHQGHAGASRASKLLEKPDKLIGIILIGNNFVNFLAASVASSIAIVLLGNPAPFATAVVLTLVVLVFAEVTPKTIAALYPEKIAYPSSIVLGLLLKILYPAVWVINRVSNFLVRLLGFHPKVDDSLQQLNPDELRTVVHESRGRLPKKRQGMLLNILDLEKVRVDDIMVNRHDVIGINLEDDMQTILDQISGAHHTRIPVFKGDIDNIIGILHMRSVGKLMQIETLNKAVLIQQTVEPYFIPESTPLHTQLFAFQNKKKRLAVIVDEYGAVRGIVTLEDILEEIVGEFTTDKADSNRDIHRQEDGSYLIDGSISIRDLNKALGWDVDSRGAKTLNGLLMEILQSIPDSHVGVRLAGYNAEIMQIQDNRFRTIRMWEQNSSSEFH